MISSVQNIKKWIFSGLVFTLLVLSLFYHSENRTNEVSPHSILAVPQNVWVSMALCWGTKVNIVQKSNFPYELAGKLSTKLWHKLTPVKVLFQIVICHLEELERSEFKNYVKELNEAGAIVKIVKIENCDNCVLTAQLSRFLAFRQPEVRNYIFKRDFLSII